MIKIIFLEPVDALFQDWKQRCALRREDDIRTHDNGYEVAVDNALYKETKRSHYFARSGPFKGKCAYCETYVAENQSQPGDVEHFRPKGQVSDFDHKIVKIVGSEKDHPGYYWLTYEWTNLLPSCASCNRSTNSFNGDYKIGKGSRFPVKGVHAEVPGDETDEEHLLIHPVIDDPQRHLEPNNLGLIFPKTDRGKLNIELFGLNERDLHYARRDAYMFAFNRILAAFAMFSEGLPEEALRIKCEIEELLNGSAEYSLFFRAGYEDAKSFFS